MKARNLIVAFALTCSTLAFSSCNDELESISLQNEMEEQSAETIGDGDDGVAERD